MPRGLFQLRGTGGLLQRGRQTVKGTSCQAARLREGMPECAMMSDRSPCALDRSGGNPAGIDKAVLSGPGARGRSLNAGMPPSALRPPLSLSIADPGVGPYPGHAVVIPIPLRLMEASSPPSTGMFAPFIHALAGASRNAMTAAISSGFPSRGELARNARPRSRFAELATVHKGVSTGPGLTQLNRSDRAR